MELPPLICARSQLTPSFFLSFSLPSLRFLWHCILLVPRLHDRLTRLEDKVGSAREAAENAAANAEQKMEKDDKKNIKETLREKSDRP